MQSKSKLFLLYEFCYVCISAVVFFVFPSLKKQKDVAGKIVLITGGGSGIGRLLAQRFAKKGAKVVIWDVNETGLADTKSSIEKQNGYCKTYVCDVSDRSYVYTTAEKVISDVGHVDILINNAGIVTGREFLHLNDEAVVRSFQVNVLAHFWTCKAFLPYMVESNSGHIVTVSSVAGMVGTPSLADYCATKSACVGLHESLWLENRLSRSSDINFTLVCPFFMSTGMFEGVNTGIIPIVKPDYASDEIFSAILRNEDFLFIPRIFSFLYALKAVIPDKAVCLLFKLLNVEQPMKDFVGRSHRNNSPVSNGGKTN